MKMNDFTAVNTPAQLSNKMIIVRTVNKTIKLSVDEIACFQGEGNYSTIFLLNGKKYIVTKTLKHLEYILDDTFIRVHKSFLINSDHIESVYTHDRILKLVGGKEVSISRRKKKEINQRISSITA